MKYEVRKQRPNPGIVPKYTLHRIGLLGVEEAYYLGIWSRTHKSYYKHFSHVLQIITNNNFFPYEIVEEKEDAMRYEIHKDHRLYILFRIDGSGEKRTWLNMDGVWHLSRRTCFDNLDSLMNVVREHKFFPCVVIQDEVLPLPVKEDEEEEETPTPEPEVPTITFKDLDIGQKYIHFSGSDNSNHYVFLKVSDTEAFNLAYATKKSIPNTQKTVIKVEL